MRVSQANRVVTALVVVACVLGMLSRLAAAEPTAPAFPSTEFGVQCDKWFDAFNSGDYAVMQQSHMPADPEPLAKHRALRDYQVYLMTRGIVPDSIEQTSESTIVVVGREKVSGNHVNLIVRGSNKPPFAITEFGLRPGKLPENKRRHASAQRNRSAEGF